MEIFDAGRPDIEGGIAGMSCRDQPRIQRRAGSCRFGDMQIFQPGAATLKL